MAKGLAVVSGSNDVVFKALETGIITMGSVTSSADVTVTGSLTINKHSGGDDPLVITGLSSSATSNAADKILVIDTTTGVVREAEKLDSDDVYFTGSGETLSQFSGSANSRLESLEASVGTGVLVVSGSTEIEDVDLAGGSIRFLGTNLETDVTVTTSSAGNVVVTVGLVPDVTVNTLTASNGLVVSAGGANVTGDVLVTGDVSASVDLLAGGNLDVEGTANVGGTLTVESGGANITGNISGSGTLQIGSTSTLGGTVTVTTGDIVASNGNISGSGTLQVGGNTNIGGNLTVAGDFLVEGFVTTINTNNLTVEDAIILVGSGSSGSTGELGIVFGSTDSRGFSVEGGEFYLGTTAADASTANINVTDNGILHLGALSASVGVNALQVEVGANGLTVAGDTSLNGNVTLGDASTDVVTINGYITGSGSPIIVSSSLTIGDAGNVNNEVTTFVSQVRMPIYTISGDALEGTFPAIPAAYISSPTAQGGHMFYLTASTNVGLGNDSVFPEANKWYMNERGVWHESFFFVG